MANKGQLTFLLVFVFQLARISSARHSPWASGNEYAYRMRTISTSDIPGLGPQAAGVKLESQLIVQCRDSSSIVVKLANITSWEFHGDVKEVWEEVDAPTQFGARVILDGKAFLERPFLVRFREGLFESLGLSQDEPLWSVNVKKAIASKLQLHVSGSRSLESVLRNFDVPSDESTENVNAVFQVYEDGVTGVCETVYEIAPLSDALIRSDSKLNPVPEMCAEGTFFQVVKTKNYSKCRSRRPIFNIIAPSGWRCRPGASTCDTALSRSSVNRYVACGSLESFSLLKMTHQGEVRVSPYAYETEQLRAITVMKLTLQAVRRAYPTSHGGAAGRRAPNKDLDVGRVITSLVFTFPGLSAAGVPWRSDGLLKAPSRRDTDQLQPAGETRDAYDTANLLAVAVHQAENNQEEAAIDSISLLSQLITRFDYQQILYIVGDLEKKSQTERSVILDAIIAAGTNAAILFLKETIVQRRLSKLESVEAIAGLPMYVRTPTQEMLNELYNMMIQLKDSPDRSVYHAAMLSVSQLVHVACVNVTEARTRFPTTIFGHFCLPNDTIIVNKLIPFLGKEIYFSNALEEKMVGLTALGEIGHEAIIPIVFPIIRGKEHYSTLLRTRAVISLHKLAHDSNEKALDVLTITFQNPSECSEVRMAAFTLMVLANPPGYWWQKMAVSTWFEPCVQVASFVYTTFASLASDIQPLGNIKPMSEKAQIVLPLVKRAPVGLKWSQNFKWSHTLPKRNAGAEFHHEVIHTMEALVPKSFYSRLSWALGPYHFDVFELELYGQHWDRAAAKIFSYLGGSESRNVHHSQDSDLHPELVRIKKQLNAVGPLPVRDIGSADGFIHVSFMKAIHRFKMFEVPDVLLDFYQRFLAPRNVNTTRSEFSYQKWAPFAHAETLMPNNFGFLVETRAQAHFLARAKGQTHSGLSTIDDLHTPAGYPGIKNLGLEIDVKPTLVVKLHSAIAINVDFAKVVTSCGVDTSVSFHFPGRFSFSYAHEESKLLFAWEPVPTSVGLSTLFHHRVTPFTSLKKTDRANRFNATAGVKRVAAAGVTPQNREYSIGRKSGLHFVCTSQTEVPMNAEWQRQSPLDFITNLNFALLPASLHWSSFRIDLDIAKSHTKKVRFSIQIDTAEKLGKDALILNLGSKTRVTINESEQQIQFSSNVEPHIKKQLEKVLDKVPRGQGVYAEAKLTLESVSASAKTYGATFAGSFGAEGTNKLSVNAHVELPIEQNNEDVFTACVEAEGQYPRSSFVDRRNLFKNALEASWNATVGFGDMCDGHQQQQQQQHQLTFRVDMKRSDGYSRYVLDSAESRECALHESRGEHNHERCRAVRRLATILDEYEANVKYGQVPPVLINATRRFEAWLRSWLHGHVTSERHVAPGSASDDELKILINVHPSLSAFDATIFKPTSNVFFRSVPLPETVNFFFPLNVETSVAANDGLSRTCRIEKSTITTFDNVQYNVSINNCEHVVMAVPAIDSFAILARQEETQKVIVTVLLGRDRIAILPALSKVLYNEVEVSLQEDQPLEVHHQSSDQGGSSLRVYKADAETFKITVHLYKVNILINAHGVVAVTAPRWFQGKLIGLCGNMDGEPVAELRDAQRCVLSSGALMAASYRLHEAGRQCTAADKIRAQLREEQTVCRSERERPTSLAGCFARRTMVLYRDDAKCFSTTPIAECRPPCHGHSLRAFNIGFHCLPNSKAADALAHEAKFNESPFASGKKEDLRITRYLPTVCQPMAQLSSSSSAK